MRVPLRNDDDTNADADADDALSRCTGLGSPFSSCGCVRLRGWSLAACDAGGSALGGGLFLGCVLRVLWWYGEEVGLGFWGPGGGLGLVGK